MDNWVHLCATMNFEIIFSNGLSETHDVLQIPVGSEFLYW